MPAPFMPDSGSSGVEGNRYRLWEKPSSGRMMLTTMKRAITPQPTYLFGLNDWTNTASTAKAIMSTLFGSKYQRRYLPSSKWGQLLARSTPNATTIEKTSEEIRTKATAAVFGTT